MVDNNLLLNPGTTSSGAPTWTNFPRNRSKDRYPWSGSLGEETVLTIKSRELAYFSAQSGSSSVARIQVNTDQFHTQDPITILTNKLSSTHLHRILLLA
jgi:hypothetical protein